MTGSLHRKRWASDRAEEKRNERKPLGTIGIRKVIQWRVKAWITMPKDIVKGAGGSRFAPTVGSLHSIIISRGASDEGKTYVVSDDTYVSTFRQFLQPHIGNLRVIAKYEPA